MKVTLLIPDHDYHDETLFIQQITTNITPIPYRYENHYPQWRTDEGIEFYQTEDNKYYINQDPEPHTEILILQEPPEPIDLYECLLNEVRRAERKAGWDPNP